ncbi:MAG: hypothetical protein HOP08_18495 [Cyclobacteriaceae bacterium]|nr:hypothetical protein [Cyclobacteriaceae bacterium]
MLRKISGVIAGYAIFVASSVILFKVSGQNPHGETSTGFKLLTAVYGTIFSLLGGLVLQLIARTKNLNINYVLALIIAGFATFSFFKAEGNHWSQLLAIFVFAPASILGGFFLLKRN